MEQRVEAIFLDVGNTLRILTDHEDHQARARKKITELVGTEEDPDLFIQKVDERYKEYRKWAFDHLQEASEAELWTRWLSPEFPKEKIAANGIELTYLYNVTDGEQVTFDENTRILEWKIDSVPAYAGIFNPAPEARIQLAIVPTSEQINKSPLLLTDILATATDAVTNAFLTAKGQDISIAIFPEPELNIITR